MFKQILLQAIKGFTKESLILLYESLSERDKDHFADDLILGYRFFKRMQVFAAQSKGTIDDTIVEINLDPIIEVAKIHGILLPGDLS